MLRAVYKTGSSLILPNPKDIDYICYYDTNEERIKALAKNRNIEANNHFRVFGSEPKIFLGCYIYPYMEKVQGEDIDFKSFNLFDSETKSKYIELLRKYASCLPNENKKWYHIYIAVSIYENGKNKLTKKQIATAQKIHDKGVDEEMKQYLFDYLQK